MLFIIKVDRLPVFLVQPNQPMKKHVLLSLVFLLSLLICLPAAAQLRSFNKRWVFSSINGNPTKYRVYTSLKTKEHSFANVASPLLFEGEPDIAQVDASIYPYSGSFIGQYFTTPRSNVPLSFIMDYGFDDVDGDQRIHFDRITVATGDYKTSETPEKSLSAQDVSYDCNIVQQNCRVYQRHYFDVDRSSVYKGGKHPYVKSIIIRYYKDNKIAKTLILPFAVLGNYQEYLYTGPGPIELYTILRSAPGDQSVTFLEKESSVASEVTMGLQESNSQSTTISWKASAGFSAGPLSAKTTVEGSKTTTTTKVSGKEDTYNVVYTTNKRIESDNSQGDYSDKFVAQRRQYEYGLGYEIGVRQYRTAQGDFIKLEPKITMLFYPVNERVGGIEEFFYSENQLRNEVIPNLERFNKSTEAKFWRNVIAENNRLKALAKNGPKKVINSGFGAEQSTTIEKAESFTVSQELTIEKTKSLSIENEVGFKFKAIEAGGSAKAEKTWTFSTTRSSSSTNSNANIMTVGYKILDDELTNDDRLIVNMWEDKVLGTPVFELDPSSATSCPYEGGYQLDQPAIFVKDPKTGEDAKSAKFSDVEFDKEVTFDVKVQNRNTRGNRKYKLRYAPPSGGYTPNAIISGSVNGVVPPYNLGPGNSQQLTIRISNATPDRKQAYKDMMFILEPECGGSDDDGYVADTILLSVYYGDTDGNRSPDNNTVASAYLLPNDGRLNTSYVNKFGTESRITNKNATTFPAEQTLVPPTNCTTGWCAEAGGKPEITNSVWFKFVTTTPEAVVSTCHTMNSGFDSQIAVFKVGNINNPATFTRIGASDNNACSANNAILSLKNLTIGDTLYILVDGFQGAQSDFGISVKAIGPRNDIACDDIILRVNGVATTGYYNYAATAEENENVLIPASDDPIVGWKDKDPIQHSVWFTFVAPDLGEVIIEVVNATFDAQVAVFEQSRVCNPEFFPQFTHMGANDDVSLAGGLNSRLVLKGLKKGKPYGILVDGYKGAMGTFDMKLSIPIPDNDEPCNAIALETDATGQGEFSNGGASASDAEQAIAPPTVEINKPGGWSDVDDRFGRKIETSVWFKFVAPSGGAVTISTCNQASFIAQMAVYRTTDCSDWSKYKLIAADDNSQICRQPPSNDYPNGRGVRGSILHLEGLEADSTYYILIDGNMTAFGRFSIDIITAPSDPPVNDDACKAIALPANGVVQKGFTTMGATSTKTEYKIVPTEWKDNKMGGTVWFTFVAPASGEAEISTCDLANFDTQLAVYKVDDCKIDSNFVLMGANEDGPSNCSTNGDSFLQLKGLTPGTTYYIVVDGYGKNKGNFSIVVRDQITPGPANDNADKAILIAVDGKVNTGFTNAYATVQEKEQDIRPKSSENQDCTTGWCDNQVDNSVWFKFVAPADGVANISTCDLADYDTQLAVYSATNENDLSTFTLIAANDAGPEDCSTDFDSYLPVTALTPGRTYYVMVDGFDGASGKFNISISPTPDTQAPSAPTNLQATDRKTTSISVSWNASTDNVGVKEYLVYLNGNLSATTSNTTHTFSNLTASTAYQVSVKAKDAAGNESASSATLNVSTTAAPDTQAPTAPANLTATETGTTSVKVSWGASSDNVGVKEYRIYVDNTQKGITSETNFTITGLAAATAYSIYVVAVDAAGNASNPSNTLKVTTTTAADTQAPTTPSNLTATEVTSTSVKVTWGASTDNVGVKEYRVYLDAALKGTTTNTTFTLSGLTAATAYSIYVVAVDEAGNASNPSTALKVTTTATVDTQAPTAPTNLVATETNSTDVKVSWTASTDNVGVKEYRVFVDNTQTVTSTTTSATISGLTASTAYSIHVVAVDAAGNVSGSSNVLKVTTAAVTVTIVLSVNPSALSEEVKAYPNPFRDEIVLEFPTGFHYVGNVEVRDILGRAVQSRNLEDAVNRKLRLDMSDQPTGMFFLLIKQKDTTIHKQLLKR